MRLARRVDQGAVTPGKDNIIVGRVWKKERKRREIVDRTSVETRVIRGCKYCC